MLKKILNIENVGKFRSCKPKGDVEFRRLTLIYAENGRGKTTLCDIIRSLQTGKGEYVQGRSRLGGAGEPRIELRLEQQNARFEGGAWSATVPQIAIFDGAFVHDNVYAGEFVEHEQKRNLYGVIIGAKGIALQQQVSILDEESREAARRLRNAEQLLHSYLPSGIGERDFVEIKSVEGSDERISATEQELRALERASDVASRPLLTPVELPAFALEFEALLTKTVEGIAADVEARVRDHLSNHTRDATQSWISEGMRFTRDDTCPFCGRETARLPLLAAYSAYFSDRYRALRNEIKALRGEVERIGSEATVATLARAIEQNQARTEFWREFVTYGEPMLPADEIVPALTGLTLRAVELVVKKEASLLERVEPGADFATARTQYDQATAKVKAYNKAVERANASIAEKKAATQLGNISSVREELSRLRTVKRRFEANVEAACSEYAEANKAKERVEEDKVRAKAALDEHGGTILPEFQSRINQLLRYFGAGFRVQNVETSYAGGRASSTYQLLINEVPVELGDSSTPIGRSSFRNTLSAGDRSTLALAFFITQLELDPDLENQIVVLDDPFASQDSARRTCTQQRISRLSEKAKQVIVLSHEASFLRLVYDAVPTSSTVRTLQLARAGPEDTLITEWDVIEATRTSYQKDYLSLQRYSNLGQGEPRYVARAIRPLLEGYLRTLFPAAFPDNEWLGDFIAKIREAAESDRLSNMKPALADLEDLNDYSKRYHHNTNPGAEHEIVDEGELQTYVQRALDFVSAPPSG